MGSSTTVSPVKPLTMVSMWVQTNGRSESPHWGARPNSSSSRPCSVAVVAAALGLDADLGVQCDGMDADPARLPQPQRPHDGGHRRIGLDAGGDHVGVSSAIGTPPADGPPFVPQVAEEGGHSLMDLVPPVETAPLGPQLAHQLVAGVDGYDEALHPRTLVAPVGADEGGFDVGLDRLEDGVGGHHLAPAVEG